MLCTFLEVCKPRGECHYTSACLVCYVFLWYCCGVLIIQLLSVASPGHTPNVPKLTRERENDR